MPSSTLTWAVATPLVASDDSASDCRGGVERLAVAGEVTLTVGAVVSRTNDRVTAVKRASAENVTVCVPSPVTIGVNLKLPWESTVTDTGAPPSTDAVRLLASLMLVTEPVKPEAAFTAWPSAGAVK